ncbi:MAG: glycosyltransferase family 2 protein [Cyanobacterium sp.]
MKSELTLIISYRQRQLGFYSFYNWFTSLHFELRDLLKVVFIESDKQPSLTIQEQLEKIGINYFFVQSDGVFHKTSLLNHGLNLVNTKYSMAYDVDLIPYKNSLFDHLDIAKKSAFLLVTAYRLMVKQSFIDDKSDLNSIIEQSAIAPEDKPRALKKHLISHEKFGVLPIFRTEELERIGGWDEEFVGWGGEDQDMIERYSNLGYNLCRVPDLVYLHLNHHHNSDWYSPEIIKKNREYYYQKYSKNDSKS